MSSYPFFKSKYLWKVCILSLLFHSELHGQLSMKGPFDLRDSYLTKQSEPKVHLLALNRIAESLSADGRERRRRQDSIKTRPQSAMDDNTASSS